MHQIIRKLIQKTVQRGKMQGEVQKPQSERKRRMQLCMANGRGQETEKEATISQNPRDSDSRKERRKKLTSTMEEQRHFGGKLSFILSFSLCQNASTPTCTSIIITLKPCAFNVQFQHFILRFDKVYLLLVGARDLRPL